MAKAASIEERLADVARLSKEPDTPETRKQIRTHLAGKVSLIVARTAEIVGRLQDHDFVPDLIAAFNRFMTDAVKTDKGCAAKTAIVKALLAADCDDEKLFLTGIRHVQLEPTWGGRADTAAPLRALCGLGLVQAGSPDAINELAALLADNEGDARIGAARALGHSGPAASALLRFKVLTGDAEPAVIAECFNGLMSLSPSASFEFVARFVDQRYPELYEHAALALSESRLPGVFELLKERSTATFDREFKQALLLPIALTRSEDGLDYLISVLETGDVKMATAAIAALSIYGKDAAIRRRAEEALVGPNKAQLLAALNRQ
ncbi:MAG TPA: HEAT repeat domain-containing protein, partial [Blastocatellia bacterium]|nr:HEAT repeat domain-containing protein [Blastocatellia bacterium]